MSRTAKLLLFSIAFTAFTIGAVLVSGCQSSQPQDSGDFNDDPPLDRRIGEIRSLGGVRTESRGTHLLQLDNGDTILLKSLAINLDDDKYSGETVEVRGVLTYNKDSKPLMEVMNIDILEQYEADEAAKAKWVTYNNDEYEFSIKYRDDFEVKESLDGVIFEIMEEMDDSDEKDPKNVVVAGREGEDNYVEPTSRHLIAVELVNNENGLLNYLDAETDGNDDLLAAGLTKSKVGANDLDAYKSEAMDGAGLYFYVANDDYIYTISFEAGSDAAFREAQNMFYEMLGTFKIDSHIGPADKDATNEEEDNVTDSDNEDDTVNNADINDEEDDEGETEAIVENDDTEVADGFNVFENETFEFSIQYPKNWYYSGGDSNDNGVARRYEFGDEPTDEQPGNVYLDVYNGNIPSGTTTVSSDINSIVKTGSGNLVEIFIETEDDSYRLSGPANIESTLIQMAKSLE